MGKKAVFVLGLLMGLTGCYSLKPPSIPILTPSLPPIAFANETQLAQIEQSIYKEINQYRQSRRLPPLKLHRQISQQARLHSQRMGSQVTPFGHQGFQERAETIGLVLPYQNIAENVAINRGYQDPATVAVKGWLESPGHLQNIQGDFNLTGIGVSQDGEGKYYFAQIFLKQRAPNSSTIPQVRADGIGFLERETHRQVNQYRLSQNLPLLQLDERVSYEARLFSRKMARKAAKFSHDGFDERGKAVGKSIPWQKFGENLAYSKGYTDPVGIAVKGWIESPGHRQNMEGDFETTGIGIAQNDQGEYYFTQLFIKKR